LQHDVTKLFEPDVLAEQRYFQAHRLKHVAEPERALLLAVLSEAIETFRKFAFSKSARGQNLFRQAKEWLCDDDPDYFFSCKNICEVMGLDACYLRRGLLQWLEERRGPTADHNADTLSFVKIGRPRHRTVYTQRHSLMRRRTRGPKADGCCDADHPRRRLQGFAVSSAERVGSQCDLLCD
jgi:hypothetical protein